MKTTVKLFKGDVMATLIKISPQGQIRIPRKIMTRLGMEEGDYVEKEMEE